MEDGELWMTEKEFDELNEEMIQENIESGYYRTVRNKRRAKKLSKRENVEVFFHEPINAWLWTVLDDHSIYDDGSEHVECHGSGSGDYDNYSGSSGSCWA